MVEKTSRSGWRMKCRRLRPVTTAVSVMAERTARGGGRRSRSTGLRGAGGGQQAAHLVQAVMTPRLRPGRAGHPGQRVQPQQALGYRPGHRPPYEEPARRCLCHRHPRPASGRSRPASPRASATAVGSGTAGPPAGPRRRDGARRQWRASTAVRCRVALQQLPHRDHQRRVAGFGARRAVLGYQFPARLPGQRGITVYGKRPLDAAAAGRVKADHDAYLPHAGAALAQRPRAPLRPACAICPIPITGSHPYS